MKLRSSGVINNMIDITLSDNGIIMIAGIVSTAIVAVAFICAWAPKVTIKW